MREPWFAAYHRPGRNGRIAAGAAMTNEERNLHALAAKTAEAKARTTPATVLDTVAEALGETL